MCGENIVCAKCPDFAQSKILVCLKRPNFAQSKILVCLKRPNFVQSKYFACQKWPDFAQNKPRENILAPQRDGDIRRTGKTRLCDPSGHITPSFEDSASSLLFFPLLPLSYLILLLHLSSSSRYRNGTVLYCIEAIACIISYDFVNLFSLDYRIPII